MSAKGGGCGAVSLAGDIAVGAGRVGTGSASVAGSWWATGWIVSVSVVGIESADGAIWGGEGGEVAQARGIVQSNKSPEMKALPPDDRMMEAPRGHTLQ
jgi:hypothetical protein